MPAVWPSVSIIVAAHGRHAATRACITSLLALDYPGGPCEIIVVDDASEPPLAPALDGLPIRLIRVEQNIGQSAARNRAAADAQGDLLAFIDNDCVAEPDWLRASFRTSPILASPSSAAGSWRRRSAAVSPRSRPSARRWIWGGWTLPSGRTRPSPTCRPATLSSAGTRCWPRRLPGRPCASARTSISAGGRCGRARPPATSPPGG
ncbi:MAG: glycosyltransferase [Rhodospirillales bacterium]